MTPRTEVLIKDNLSSESTRTIIKLLNDKNEWSSLTNEECLKKAAIYRQKLKDLGCAPGDRVGLLAENSIEWALVLLAIWECHGTAVLFDPKLLSEQLENQISFLDLQALFISNHQQIKLTQKLKENLSIFNLEKDWEKVTCKSWLHAREEKDKNKDIALIIYTSGTSGNYLPVMLDHSSVIASIHTIMPRFTNQKVLAILPWNHIFGLMVTLLIPFARKRGHQTIVVQKFTLESFSEACLKEHPTFLPVVPRVLSLIYSQIKHSVNQSKSKLIVELFIKILSKIRKYTHINLGRIVFYKIHKSFGGKLRYFISAGASLDPMIDEYLDALGFSVAVAYGLTETCGQGSQLFNQRHQLGNVGKPAGNCTFHIAFPDDQNNGEICVKSTSLLRGYFHHPEETHEHFREGWFRTGDRGHIDKRGNLVITGRIKELIVPATGKKVSPEEIERNYKHIPGVKEMAVVGVAQEHGMGDEIYAALVLDHHITGHEVPEQIKSLLMGRGKMLPTHMQIQRFFAVRELPKTSTLKVKRNKLREELLEIESQGFNPTPTAALTDEEMIIAEYLINELSSIMQHSKISLDKRLSEIGLDSLGGLSLVNNLNRKHPNIVTIDEVFNNPTVAGLATLMNSTLKAPKIIGQNAETAKRTPIRMPSFPPILKNLKTKNIFLTGATGVLGSYMLKTILEQTDSQIHCLIRADDKANALKRLKSFLETYQVKAETLDRFNKRVEVVLGDVAKDHFGLDEKTYRTLVSTIDLTIHSAAKVSLHGAYDSLVEINVNGTKRAIDFAIQTPQKYLAYISSYSIMGDRQFQNLSPFKENDFDLGQDFTSLGYQKTKFESELTIREATAKGLQWIIFRPGDIFGDSATGSYPLAQSTVSGIFYDIFKTIIETKCAADSPLYFDMTPVDYVAKGILHFCLNHQLIYSTFHLINPTHIKYNEIVHLIKKCGFEIELISPKEYIDRLEKDQLYFENREYHSMTTEFFQLQKKYLLLTDSSYADSAYTQNLLKEVGIVCHPVDHKLIKNYLSYCEKVGYFTNPLLK